MYILESSSSQKSIKSATAPSTHFELEFCHELIHRMSWLLMWPFSSLYIFSARTPVPALDPSPARPASPAPAEAWVHYDTTTQAHWVWHRADGNHAEGYGTHMSGTWYRYTPQRSPETSATDTCQSFTTHYDRSTGTTWSWYHAPPEYPDGVVNSITLVMDTLSS